MTKADLMNYHQSRKEYYNRELFALDMGNDFAHTNEAAEIERLQAQRNFHANAVKLLEGLTENLLKSSIEKCDAIARGEF